MTRPVCFVDTETAGLRPDSEIWEVGLITPDGEEHHWFLPLDVEAADPIALSIGGYHERHPQGNHSFNPDYLSVCEPRELARSFAKLTHGLHLAGAVVSFDALRLERLMLLWNVAPSWHYHLVDVEGLAAGWLARDYGRGWPAVELPWDSNELSLAVGVDPKSFDRHTALSDCRWAKAIFEAVMGE